jgi:hypothetical protein
MVAREAVHMEKAMLELVAAVGEFWSSLAYVNYKFLF